MSIFLGSHKFWGFGRVRRIQEFRERQGKLFELDWLRNIRIEAGFYALGVNIAKHVRRERDDRMAAMPVFLFPPSYLFTGLISIFVRHVKITLRDVRTFNNKDYTQAYQDNRIVANRFGENGVGTLNTIQHCLSLYRYFG
jgi:hypothetical protein